MHYRVVLAVPALVVLLGACTSLQAATAAQTGCRASEIRIVEERGGLGSHTWVAECRGRTYQCAKIRAGGVGGTTTYQLNCTADPDSPVVAASSSRPQRREQTGPRVSRVRQRGSDGSAFWLLRATLQAGGARVVLAAAPARDATRVAMVVAGRELLPQCEVGLMLDGELSRLPVESTVVAPAGREYRVFLTLDLLRRMGSATRVAGRVCDHEWRFGIPERAAIRELIARIDEELAWSGSATTGGDEAAQPEGAESP